MCRVRALVARLAAAWLLMHACATVGTTMVIAATADHQDVACTCKHGGEHATCPMHHGKSDATRCRMQSAPSHGDAALVSILGSAGLPVHLVTSYDADIECATVTQSLDHPLALLVPPDPPPPRF